MIPLGLPGLGERLSVLCLGAHADDIEIGAGGTLLSWISAGVKLDVWWCVLSATGERRVEAEASAHAMLDGADHATVEITEFKDGYFPYQGEKLKSWMQALGHRTSPDVILTHRRDDAHQDHREVCKLTYNAFRNHLILEYEIPKWDGDLGQPNFYVPLSEDILRKKIELLERYFGTQRSKDWFDADTFRSLARLRGMECRAPGRFAEAYCVRKAVFSPCAV